MATIPTRVTIGATTGIELTRIARSLLLGLVCLAVGIAGCIVLVTQPFVSASVFEPPPVDARQLEAHVRHLSVDLYPRSYDQFRKIESAAQYVQEQFRLAGAVVSVQDVKVDETSYKNVIAHFGPLTGPVMVIGAHYDSHGDANGGAKFRHGFAPETHTPGADDNASGVAGLLELARLLGRTPQTHAIELVAYTLEEPPHFRTDNMGSAWHANALRAQGRDVAFMLSLEMIGYFSDAPGSQHYPVPGMQYLYSDRGDFIALVGKLSDFSTLRNIKAAMRGASDLPVLSMNAPPLLPGVDFSDHVSYWNEGFPAFMVTDTAFMRNPNYHQAEDSFEKLDYARMAKVVQAVYAVTQSQR